MKQFLSSAALVALATGLAPATAQGATTDEYFGAQDAAVPEVEAGTVTVTISGVEPGAGDVYVALQTEEGFAQAEGEYTTIVTPDGAEVTATFEDVEPGEYAVAAFQDTDGDGSLSLLDTGPTEPYAFSGDVTGVPSFDDAMFEVEGDGMQSIVLIGGAATGGAAMTGDTAMEDDEAEGASVSVRVTGVQPDGGDVYVALQTEDGFAEVGGEYTQVVTPDGRTARVTFEGVEPGEYAVAAFQDTDGDGLLVLTETGPVEPWGFSGRRAQGAPEFDRAMFEVEDDTRARVRLREGQSPVVDTADTVTGDAAAGAGAAALAGAGATAAMQEGSQDDEPATVTVTVDGADAEGDVFVALQTEEMFATADGQYTRTATPENGSASVTFADVAPGQYAVAAFQDTDGDGTVTIGETGPNEPWALSGTTSGAPSFEGSAVTFDADAEESLTLQGGTTTAATQPSGDDMQMATVSVRIRGVDADGGDVYVALQTEDGFAEVGGEYTQVVTPDGRTVELTFEDVEPGEYAVAAFQDTDGDGTVTIGEAGPSEPWGLSGRRTSGAPEFDRAMFEAEGETDATVRLRAGSPDAAAGERTDTGMGESDTAMTDEEDDASFDPAVAAAEPVPAAQPADAAANATRSAELSGMSLTAGNFLDQELLNAEDDDIARVVDVVLTPAGEARGVVLRTGGLFGIGADYYAVNFDRVTPEQDGTTLVLRSNLTEADVERLREFDYSGFQEDPQGLLLASDLQEADVTLSDGETASVSDLIMTADGRAEAVVIGYDGVDRVVPFPSVTADADGVFTVDMTAAELAEMAAYEPAEEALSTAN